MPDRMQTLIALQPMVQRLGGLVADGRWEEANREAEKIRQLVGEVCRHTAELAQTARQNRGEMP